MENLACILPHKILLSDKLPGVWHKTFPEFFVAETFFRQITVTKENYLAVTLVIRNTVSQTKIV